MSIEILEKLLGALSNATELAAVVAVVYIALAAIGPVIMAYYGAKALVEMTGRIQAPSLERAKSKAGEARLEKKLAELEAQITVMSGKMSRLKKAEKRFINDDAVIAWIESARTIILKTTGSTTGYIHESDIQKMLDALEGDGKKREA